MPLQVTFGNTVELLGKSLDLRNKRQALISANIANAETPGYSPSDLSFEAELKAALNHKGSASLTNPRHIPLKGVAASLDRVEGVVLQTPPASPGPDGNGVEMEGQMEKLAENQIMYNASVQLLGTQFDMMKQAIKGTL